MNYYLENIIRDKKKKTENIKGGYIVQLSNQTQSVDFYDVMIDNKLHRNIPCPVPSWLQDQLELENEFSLIYSRTEKLRTERKPLFRSGENVQIIYENGNINQPKISLENSGKNHIEPRIIYF